jgi:hypothetical protein
MHTHKPIYAHTYTHTHVHTHVCLCTLMAMGLHACDTQRCTHTYAHTYTHTYTHSLSFVLLNTGCGLEQFCGLERAPGCGRQDRRAAGSPSGDDRRYELAHNNAYFSVVCSQNCFDVVCLYVHVYVILSCVCYVFMCILNPGSD